MGCCCSSTEADALANWIDEQPCQCPEQYYFTTNLIWEVVPIIAVVSLIYVNFPYMVLTHSKALLL
jgi:hypothetical protein